MIGLKYLYAMLAGAFSGQPALNLRGRRPTGSQLRNPADPIQAARIETAATKRERRADKLQYAAAFSTRNNDAWFTDGATPGRLNPFNFSR